MGCKSLVGNYMNDKLLEISDGRLYGKNDMARLACHDCQGCSSCCEDMDDSIILDPYDIHILSQYIGKSFEELLATQVIELKPVEGLILPNLKMVDKYGKLCCSFLNEEGRCDIHDYRPGICRLFPLGRNYEDGKLSYFVLKDGCTIPASRRQKIKIDKWLGYGNMKEYEDFLIKWHGIRGKVRSLVNEADDEAYASAITTGFLKLFYMKAYESDFFEEFSERLNSL